MPTYLSHTKLAQMAGVARQSVGERVKKGSLPSNSKGRIPLEHEATQAFLERHKALDQVKKAKKTNPPPSQSGDDNQSMSVESEPQGQESGSYSRATLENWRLQAQIRKIGIETSMKRGDLVKKDTVKATFAKLWSIDTAQWQQLGSRIAPELASAFGRPDDAAEVKAREIVDDAVEKTLQHTKSLLVEWIKDLIEQEMSKNGEQSQESGQSKSQ